MRFYRETNLQDMCLTVIIFNFKSLFSLYEESEFFRRVLCKNYSQKIYQKLKKNELLEEKYTNWLISPEWKEVVFEQGHNLSYFIPKFQICGKYINSVNFKSSFAKVEILSAIVCLLPNVTEMNMSNTACNNDLLLLIRKMCPHLNSLHIAQCQVTDVGMKNLCYLNQKEVGFPSLRLLDVEETKVKLLGIKYILCRLNLQVLRCRDLELALCELHLQSEYYKPRETFKPCSLKYISLFDTSIPTLTLRVLLTMCPNIETIRIMCALMDDDYDELKKFEKISSLTIVNLALEEHSLNGFTDFLQTKGHFLTELILDCLEVSLGMIVKTCCNLKKLQLALVQYQEFDETEVVEKHNLHKLLELTIIDVNLNLSTNHKSINLLLKSCKSLESLTLLHVRSLQEIFVDHIVANMPNLLNAKFIYTDINLTSAKKLFLCKNLKYLCLDGSPYLKTDDLLALSRCYSNNCSDTLSWQIEYNEISEPFID